MDLALEELQFLNTPKTCYIFFLFAFSPLSTAAAVFTVASLYTNKDVSFSSTISTIPKIFKRLFITYLWVTLLMFICNFIFVISLVLLIIAIDTQNSFLQFFTVIVGVLVIVNLVGLLVQNIFLLFARVTITKRLIRVLYMIILVINLGGL
ncbi:hypothetical protein S83_069082 [Arachis hypogaea]